MSAENDNSSGPVIEMHGVEVGSLRDMRDISLKDVNWTVNAGQYWALAGMQGSGKSDLLSMTAGLMAPLAGEYRLFGHTMPIFGGELLSERLRIGLVFDGGQLLHQLTIRENIALPMRYHRPLAWQKAEERLDAMVDWMGLEKWANSTPSNLTRNLQKRVGLARALMLEPEVLLLDNPIGGLDPRQAQWWLNLLAELSAGHDWLHGRPMTLVVTAEDLRPWRGRAEHFGLLENERMLLLGRSADLSGHTEPLVKELLAEAHPPI